MIYKSFMALDYWENKPQMNDIFNINIMLL